MELRNINTFLHIAELHSFSRTARHLGYSQSAVSSQIAQLEAELGAPLFDRVGKTVRLTDAGQTFLGYARTLLATAQQAQAALQPAKQISGSLRIALADSVCSTFLPGLLKRYHALCPQVELVLCTTTADGMLQMLGTNQVDLAYTLDQPLLQPNLVLAADVPEPVCFIAPSGHPLAGQAEVSLEELTQQEFLLTERGMSYRDALDQCLAARGLAVHPYLELGSAALLCQMVEQGMGLSFLPEYIVRPALAAGNLARLNVPDCAVEMHRQLFYHRDKWLTPQMKAFIELVLEDTQTKWSGMASALHWPSSAEKISLKFGLPERLRTLRESIFTGRVVEKRAALSVTPCGVPKTLPPCQRLPPRGSWQNRKVLTEGVKLPPRGSWHRAAMTERVPSSAQTKNRRRFPFGGFSYDRRIKNDRR